MRRDPAVAPPSRRGGALRLAAVAGLAAVVATAAQAAAPASASAGSSAGPTRSLALPKPGSAAMSALRQAHGLTGAPLPGQQVSGENALGRVSRPPALPPRSGRVPAPMFPAAGTLTLTVPQPAAGTAAAAQWSTNVTSPVQVAAMTGARQAADSRQVSQVRVTIGSQAQARAAGASGMLLSVSRADAGATPGPVRLRVSYAGFASAYGGDFGSRLALFALPACALTTPGLRDCQSATPVAYQNNSRQQAVMATVTAPPAAASPAVLALGATASGGTGDYRATSLSPASSWQVGLQSGAFTYSYPLRVPPPIGGAAPSLSLDYNSQSTDGETAQANSQPGELGEGFFLAGAGFIERRYAACADHVSDSTNNTGQKNKTGDLCWDGNNAYLSLGGHSGQLVLDTGGTWHLASDDGSIVRQVYGGTSNGAYNNSHWEVITPDGTQYWFGLSELPGYQSGYQATNSVFTEPVVGLHAGDPCNDPGSYSGSVCKNMAYRWNLDLVVDPNGNAASYYYAQQQASYYASDSYSDSTGEHQGKTWLPYVTGGRLTDIYYGSHVTPSATPGTAPSGSLYAHRPFHIQFGYDDRCTVLTSSGSVNDTTCNANHSSASDWPDTPWDLFCGSSSGSGCSGTEHDSPSFFDTQMLTSVTTSVYEGSPTYQAVDTWDLTYHWLPGDSGNNDLALYSITHSGDAGTATVSMPAVTFPGWAALGNKAYADGYPQVVRNRLTEMISETGAQTNISYNTPQCNPGSPGTPPDAHTNTWPCFPQIWNEGGIDPDPPTVTSWFNMYTVSQVTVTDTTPDGSPPMVTSYSYCDTSGTNCTPGSDGLGGAWHYDTDIDLVQAKDKSWDQWRGYRYVHVVTGAAGTQQSETDYTFLRGMDSDPVKNSSGGWTTQPVTLTPSDTAKTTQNPATVTDSNAVNGFQLEKITYDGLDSEAEVSDEVDWPWTPPKATATSATQPWGQPLTAWPAGTAETDTYTPLAAGGTRQTQVVNTFNNANGLPETSDDYGDLTQKSQALCTTTSYSATPSPAGLIGYPIEVKTTACGTAGDPVESDVKKSYDGQSWGAAPTAGDVTETDVWSDGDPWTSGHWVKQSVDTYDSYGRVTSSTDAGGNCTATGYVSAWGTGNPTTTVSVYAPLAGAGAGCTTSGVPAGASFRPATTYSTTGQDLNPAWGLPSDSTDASGQRTDYAYDALGRVTSVWLPGQTGATRPGDSKTANYTYTYCLASTEPACAAGMTNPYVLTQKLVSAATGLYDSSYQIYDSLLRSRQRQAFSDLGSGYATVTDTLYDSRGNVSASYGPYSTQPAPTYSPTTGAQLCPGGPSGCLWQTSGSAVPNQTSDTYDGADRKAEAGFSSFGTLEWDSTWQYPGADEVVVTPPAGGTKTATYTDARGRTTQIDQYHSATSAAYDGTSYQYAYISGGSTRTITDAGGNTWQTTYDLLGRKVSASDPDTGTTTSTYDDLGQLTSVTDNAGNTTTSAYDAAGRKTAEYNTTGGAARSPSNQLEAFTYDTAALSNPALGSTARAIGQLYSATSYVGGTGGEAYTVTTSQYSPLYQPANVSYQIPAATVAGALGGQSYQFSYGYDSAGNLTSQTYPAAGGLQQETVTYTDDSFGYPAQASGASSAYGTSYATDATYELDGQPAEIDLGTAATGTPWSKIIYSYYPDTLLLKTSSVQQQQGSSTTYTPRTSTSYNYDQSGNLLSADDSTTGDNQCYAYDYLARLTAAWSEATACPADPASPPGGTGIGGPAPYQQTLTYDNSGAANGSQNATTGDIISSDLISGAPGANQVTTDTTFDYPAYGAAQPHTATSAVTTSSDATTGPVITPQTWTADGQLATVGSTASYNWDGAGMTPGQLASATTSGATTQYRYDASGNLLLVNDAGTPTLYLPGEQLTATGSTATATRYYTLGGTTIAARTPATLDWLFSDPHGTATVAINTSTQHATLRYFTPFGQPRGTAPAAGAFPGTKGFIGGTTDTTTGQTNLGAREYNPATATFISPDPVLTPYQPTDLNPYDYAASNPATNSDPTGLMLVDMGGGQPSQEGTLENLFSSLQWNNASAAASNKSAAHNLVVVYTALLIMESAAAHHASGTLSVDFGGNAWNIGPNGNSTTVPMDGQLNEIPGAAKAGSGGMGRPDIMLQGSAATWIWEIKARSVLSEAPAQLARYIAGVPDGKGEPGWWLTGSKIPDGAGGIISAWSLTPDTPSTLGVGSGIRAYADAEPRGSRQSQQQPQEQPNPCVAATNGCGPGPVPVGGLGPWFDPFPVPGPIQLPFPVLAPA